MVGRVSGESHRVEGVSEGVETWLKGQVEVSMGVITF